MEGVGSKTERVFLLAIIETSQNKAFILDQVTYPGNLSESLRSLQRFENFGLEICVSSKKTDILVPD